MSWQHDAACRDTEYPDDWFPPRGVAKTPNEAQARNICHTVCTVRNECLEYALTHHPLEGIWGGTSDGERAELMKARPPKPLKTETHGERACYQYGCRCDLCVDANQAYERRTRGPRPVGRRDKKPCGTNAAYCRHLKAGETPCEPCVKAHNVYAAEQMRRVRRSRVEMVEEAS